ncbi:MAG: hypothetical protein ACJART_001683 [Maribacter sp.]
MSNENACEIPEYQNKKQDLNGCLTRMTTGKISQEITPNSTLVFDAWVELKKV